MLLTNTNITSKAYFHKRMGYNVVFNMASTTATGGTRWGGWAWSSEIGSRDGACS